MKTILRNTLIYALALVLLEQIDGGLQIQGGITSYLFGGLALSLLFMLLKPVLNILSLPLNIITLGFFSFLSNTIILYIATVFVPQIKISSFTFNGASFAGFIVPQMYFNSFFAFVITALILSFVVGAIEWLISR